MFHEDYAEVNGIRMHYVSAGKGKLIIFLHGFPEFWYEWKNQLQDFGKDFQAVAPDLRGYNLSSKPVEVEKYRIKVLVEDLRGLADHLGAEKFALVGHDWGGALAWVFAIAYPARLEKLVIINAPHPSVLGRELRENPAQQKASAYMLMFRTPQAEALLAANNYAALTEAVLSAGLKQGYFSEEDKKAYLAAWSQPGALAGGLNWYRAARVGPPARTDEGSFPEFSVDFPLQVVTVPALVIWGEKDPYLLTGNLDGLDEFVTDLTVRRIPDGSHWVIHEKPALVNSLMREFISGNFSKRE